MFIKRNPFIHPSVNAPDVAQKRNAWIGNLVKYDSNKLVFLDESGVNTNMTRIYGCSIGGTRSVDKAPLNTPTSTTILSSIRINRKTSYTTYSGGTTGERFLEYLKNTLIPTLHDGDIIVMDNMHSHYVKAVAETINDSAKHLKLLYLPPYSTDFNPIGKMRSKIKAILRKLRVCNLYQLPRAVELAFSKISVSDCISWFSSVGLG